MFYKQITGEKIDLMKGGRRITIDGVTLTLQATDRTQIESFFKLIHKIISLSKDFKAYADTMAAYQKLTSLLEGNEIDPGFARPTNTLEIKLLLINAIDRDKNTALGYAIQSRNIELCKFLIEHGAELPGLFYEKKGLIVHKTGQTYESIAREKDDGLWDLLQWYKFKIDFCNKYVTLANTQGTPLQLLVGKLTGDKADFDGKLTTYIKDSPEYLKFLDSIKKVQLLYTTTRSEADVLVNEILLESTDAGPTDNLVTHVQETIIGMLQKYMEVDAPADYEIIRQKVSTFKTNQEKIVYLFSPTLWSALSITQTVENKIPMLASVLGPCVSKLYKAVGYPTDKMSLLFYTESAFTRKFNDILQETIKNPAKMEDVQYVIANLAPIIARYNPLLSMEQVINVFYDTVMHEGIERALIHPALGIAQRALQVGDFTGYGMIAGVLGRLNSRWSSFMGNEFAENMGIDKGEAELRRGLNEFESCSRGKHAGFEDKILRGLFGNSNPWGEDKDMYGPDFQMGFENAMDAYGYMDMYGVSSLAFRGTVPMVNPAATKLEQLTNRVDDYDLSPDYTVQTGLSIISGGVSVYCAYAHATVTMDLAPVHMSKGGMSINTDLPEIAQDIHSAHKDIDNACNSLKNEINSIKNDVNTKPSTSTPPAETPKTNNPPQTTTEPATPPVSSTPPATTDPPPEPPKTNNNTTPIPDDGGGGGKSVPPAAAKAYLAEKIALWLIIHGGDPAQDKEKLGVSVIPENLIKNPLIPLIRPTGDDYEWGLKKSGGGMPVVKIKQCIDHDMDWYDRPRPMGIPIQFIPRLGGNGPVGPGPKADNQ